MVSKERRQHWKQVLNIILNVTSADFVDLVLCTELTEECIASTLPNLEKKPIKEVYKEISAAFNNQAAPTLNNKGRLVYPILKNGTDLWGFILLESSSIVFSTETENIVKTFIKSIEDQIKLDNICQNNNEVTTSFSVFFATNLLLENINGIPWQMNFKSNEFTYIGKQAEEILGYTISDWKTIDDWHQCIHPEDKDWAKEYFYNYCLQGKCHAFEYRLLKKDGSFIWVRDVVKVIPDIDNQSNELIGFMVDITDIKEKESELKMLNKEYLFEKELMQNFIDSIDAFVFMKDVNGELIIANKYYKTFFNRPDYNFIGKKLEDYISSEEVEGYRQKERVAIESKQASFFQYMLEDVDGENHWFYSSYFPMIDDNNEVYALCGTSVDISERIAIEKENEELKKQFEMAMDIGQIAFVEYDVITKKHKTTSYFDKLTGFDFSSIQPDLQWMISRIHPDDYEMLVPVVRQLISNKRERIEVEFRFLNIRQEYNWLCFSGVVNSGGNEKKVEKIVGIIQNIDNRKKLFQELTEERNKSLEANQAKSSFLANMSHEIRTPMNAILGFSDILSKQIKEPHLQNYMKSIRASGKTLMSLINNLLDVSKIEAGKMVLHNEALDFNAIVMEIVQTFVLKVNDKGLALEVIPASSFPKTLSLDELKIRQILLNLIGNAVKYTSEGIISIRYSFNIDENTQGRGSLIIAIEDTGVGIDENDQKRIFDPFFQEKRQINKKNEGTGLGLAITNKLVNLMGGKLSLSSKIGEGSIFTVILPNIEITQNNVIEDEEIPLEVRFNKELVLIVDDVKSNQDVLVAYAKQFNLNTILANNGLQGYQLAIDKQPKVILLDIQMPVMNGFETIEMIKNNPKLKDIPVIAISASTLQPEVQAIYQAGFNDFIDKPVKESKLIKTLLKYLKPALITEQKEEVEISGFDTMKLSSLDSSALKSEFISNVLPVWEELQIIQPSDKLKLFATILNNLSEQYEWDELKRFNHEFKASINAFDFEAILQHINNFKAFKKKIVS